MMVGSRHIRDMEGWDCDMNCRYYEMRKGRGTEERHPLVLFSFTRWAVLMFAWSCHSFTLSSASSYLGIRVVGHRGALSQSAIVLHHHILTGDTALGERGCNMIQIGK